MESNKDEKAGKSRTTSVRFTESDWTKVAEEADKASLCVSEYIRRRALKRKIPSGGRSIEGWLPFALSWRQIGPECRRRKDGKPGFAWN